MSIYSFFLKGYRKFFTLFFSAIYKHKQIDEKLILFSSQLDFSDNARTLYEYMISNNFSQKYKLIWIINEPDKSITYSGFDKIEWCPIKSYNLKEIIRFSKLNMTAKYKFSTHGYLRKERKNQITVNLWHGAIPIKAGPKKKINKYFDFQPCPSENAFKKMNKFTGVLKKQFILNTDCRLDCFFQKENIGIKRILSSEYDKTIICLPTFKVSSGMNDGITEEFIIPGISTYEQMEKLNILCSETNILLIIKVHHLQNVDKFKEFSFSNIFVLKDETLLENNIQLYELLAKTDALLTDFSSVAYDYLLLDRPIGFFLSQKDSYSRGFIDDDVESEMAGKKILSFNDLLDFVMDIKNQNDSFKAERKKIRDKYYVYQKGDNCKRLLEYLDIKK